MRLWFLFCCLSPLVAWCQKPVITSVVNAASYQAANTSSELGVGLQNGSIVTIFGTNLAACTQDATTIPLPAEMCGTHVGCGSPLFYVSPTQINFQSAAKPPPCAFPVPSVSSDSIVVTTQAGASDHFPFGTISDDASFGIFTQNSSGCGPGAVLNANADGSLSVNSPSSSVSPGGYISIFGTGLFVADHTLGFPADGSPAPLSPLVATQCGPSVFDSRQLLDGTSNCWTGLA